MANVAHSTLTGSNLHENKGAASATDNTVATASSGSTVWKKLDNTNFGPTGNPFGAGLLHVRDERVSGTQGDSLTASTWTTRTLNTTKTNEISSATISGNQISLPAGTYFIDSNLVVGTAEPGSQATDLCSSRLYNITDSLTTIQGTGAYIQDSAPNINRGNMLNIIKGRFTLAGTKVLELQSLSARGIVGGGHATNGMSEVYADVLIWKVS